MAGLLIDDLSVRNKKRLPQSIYRPNEYLAGVAPIDIQEEVANEANRLAYERAKAASSLNPDIGQLSLASALMKVAFPNERIPDYGQGLSEMRDSALTASGSISKQANDFGNNRIVAWMQENGIPRTKEQLEAFMDATNASKEQLSSVNAVYNIFKWGDPVTLYLRNQDGTFRQFKRFKGSPGYWDLLNRDDVDEGTAEFNLAKNVEKEQIALARTEGVNELAKSLSAVTSQADLDAALMGANPGIVVDAMTIAETVNPRLKARFATKNDYFYNKKTKRHTMAVPGSDSWKKLSADKDNINRSDPIGEKLYQKIIATEDTERNARIDNVSRQQVLIAISDAKDNAGILPGADTITEIVAKALATQNIPFDLKKLREKINTIYSNEFSNQQRSSDLYAKGVKYITDGIENNNFTAGGYIDWAIKHKVPQDVLTSLNSYIQNNATRLVYDGPQVLYNKFGEAQRVLSVGQAIAAREAGFDEADWDNVPHKRHIDGFDYSKVDQAAEEFEVTGRRLLAEGVEGPEGEGQWERVSETRLTNSGARIHYAEYKAETEPSFKGVQEVYNTTMKVLKLLVEADGAADGFAIKGIEKILDPTGVVRASDVDFLMEMAGIEQEWRKHWNKATGTQTWDELLTPQFRYRLAKALSIVYLRDAELYTERLGYVKEDFDAWATAGNQGKPWKIMRGKLPEWDRVVSPRKWSDAMGHSWLVRPTKREDGTVLVAGTRGKKMQSMQDLVDRLERKALGTSAPASTVSKEKTLEELWMVR